MGGKPKTTTRRCAYCNKAGHNKSTCPEFLLSQKTKPAPASPPLKFFVHHVTKSNAPSPHEVNLRSERYNAWQNVQSEAPEQTAKEFVNSPFKKSLPIKQNKELTFDTKKIIEPFLINNKPKQSSKIKLVLQKHLPTIKTKIQKIFYSPYTIIALVVMLLALTLPQAIKNYSQNLTTTKKYISAQGLDGFNALKNSLTYAAGGDLKNALEQNNLATKYFANALQIVNQQNIILKKIAPHLPIIGNKITGGKKLLLTGGQISVANNFILNQAANGFAPTSTWLEKFSALTPAVNLAVPYYREALKNLSAVNPNILSANLQLTFTKYKQLLVNFNNNLNNAAQLIKVSPELLGQNGRRRYLLVFQNPAELRPTGGFMGSLAIIEIKDGKILSLDVPPGGTYDLKGQLDTNVIPPTPLLLLNKRWEMQDANWFPNFPSSAQKILWFYRHSRGVTADGVIAINSSVLQRILTLLGPVTYSGRNLTLTASSALPTLQNIIEEGPEKKANKPKQVLADLAPVILNALSSSTINQIPALAISLGEALAQKEIQLYFTNEAGQTVMHNLTWDGALTNLTGNQDYLMVVNTNIRGQKSDAMVEQKIYHQAVVQADGSVIVTVAITREHNGVPGEKLYGQTNVNYLRLYAPLGSRLINAKGFSWPDEKIFRVPDAAYQTDPSVASLEKEVTTDQTTGTRVTNEFGKTAFGNWLITEPGATSTVEFTYRLPFTINLNQSLANYSLIVNRQSGDNSTLEDQIIFPDNWQPVYKNNLNLQLAKNGAYLNPLPLLQNTYFNILLKKTN